MSDTRPSTILERLPTGITGLDTVLGGGLPARRTCLIAGAPGTGKTTLGNQLAFSHASAGERVIVATLLSESHDVLIENVSGFSFFDRDLLGDRLRYLSVLTPLMETGLDATLDVISQEVRRLGATLVVIDGTAVIGDFATSAFDLRHFVQRLEGQFSLLGCTTVLLTSALDGELQLLSGQVNGALMLRNDLVGSRHVRSLEVIKMRGVRHAGGRHDVVISSSGIELFPRLESIVGATRPAKRTTHGMGTGIETLDTMLGGGLMPLSSTLVIGTPGAGKTILGLSFLAEGADRDEQGLMVGFNETLEDLESTARGVGLEIGRHLESGRIRVIWNPPLELSADGWAWQVLDAVEKTHARRVFIDAITDVQRIMTSPQRITAFVPALMNELRARGATTLVVAEIDAYSDEVLNVPVPAASASTDNGILLRHVEVQGRLRRLVSVLKVRQALTDPAIREMEITNEGMIISRPFAASSGLLTGRAEPDPVDGAGDGAS